MDSCPTFWHIGSWFPYSHCQPSLPSPSPPLQSTCPSVASMLPSATTSAPSSLPLPSVARSSMVPLHASSSPHPAPTLSFSSLVRAHALLSSLPPLPCLPSSALRILSSRSARRGSCRPPSAASLPQECGTGFCTAPYSLPACLSIFLPPSAPLLLASAKSPPCLTSSLSSPPAPGSMGIPCRRSLLAFAPRP